MQQYRWLVEFDIGATTYRHATSYFSVTHNGEEVQFYEGLSKVKVLQEADVDGIAISASVAGSNDWGSIVAADTSNAQGGKAKLYWWREGDNLEDADLWIDGRVLIDGVGSGSSGLSITLIEDGAYGSLLSPSAVIGLDTHPIDPTNSREAKSFGRFYNVIFGYPGMMDDTYKAYGAVPCPVSERGTTENRVIIADGRIDAAQVRLYNYTDNESGYAYVQTDTDLLGREISWVDGYGVGDSVVEEYGVGFHSDSGDGGGVVYNGDVLRGAGSIFEYLATSFTSIQVDQSRLQMHRQWLDNFKYDTFINEPVNMLEWYQDNILSYIPVKLCRSPKGYWLAPLRYTVSDNDATFRIVASKDAISSGGSMSLASDPVNELIIEYADGPYGDPLKSMVFTSTAVQSVGFRPPNDLRWVEIHKCLESEKRFGKRSETISLTGVWADSTAAAIGYGYIDAKAMPPFVLDYGLNHSFADISIGDVGFLTDAQWGLDNRIVMVDSVELTEESIEVSLLLL